VVDANYTHQKAPPPKYTFHDGFTKPAAGTDADEGGVDVEQSARPRRAGTKKVAWKK